MYRIRLLLLAFLLLLTPYLQAASAQSGHSELQTPRLEPIECPFARGAWAQNDNIECRHLVVPAKRGEASPAIRLPAAIIRARQQTETPPLVLLHGGPGLSGLTLMLRGVVQAGMASDRDVIVYDQRGAGLSEPTLCPEFTVPIVTEYTKAGRAQHRRRVRACVEWLRTRGIDPADYNTLASAQDLYDLRRALGYAKWDIYGESYGARLAQEAMRRDADGIRAVVLSSPMIVGAGRAETPVATQVAFTRLFTACRSSATCNNAFPLLENDFHALFREFQQNALIVRGDAADAEAEIALDGERMVELVRRMMRSPSGIPYIPLIVHELRSGDRMRAARELLRRGGRARGLSPTLFLVECYDQYGPSFDKLLQASRDQVAPPFRAQLDWECELWQNRFAGDSAGSVARSDIPTLIVTGEFDPVVAPEWGRRIAATLPRAYIYEVRGESHDPPAPCRSALVRQFLANPFQRPDASCVSNAPAISFTLLWPR